MNAKATQIHLFSRQPLSTLGKLTVAAFLGAAVSSCILAVVIGFPNPLLIVTAALLVSAGLVAISIRWIQLLVVLVNGVFLYQMATDPFVIGQLTNPKGEGFTKFVFDILTIACTLVAFGAGIGTSIENYRQQERTTPRSLPSALSAVAGMVVGAVLIGAISQPPTPAGTTYTKGVPTVQMNAGNFEQPSVTIPKGSKLMLVADQNSFHIIANGTWQNGVAKPVQEAGAPTINNIQVNGNNIEIGPFSTAGTYHIYCTVHQGMNLTVIVQ